jgi:hypothetical protein
MVEMHQLDLELSATGKSARALLPLHFLSDTVITVLRRTSV